MSENGLSTRIQQFLNPLGCQDHGTQSPFLRLGQHMQDILGDGGILKEVVQAGDGPPVPRDSSVSIHFSGYLEYSDQPFETTNYMKYPRMMKLGRDITLCGLELGLLTMKKGEYSRFLLLPEYAYGEMGCPPLIPPMASILYEVQVLEFLDSAQVDEFFALSPDEQNCVPLSDLLSVVDIERNFGNRCFKQSRFDDAKDRYKQAVMLLSTRETKSEEEKRGIASLQLPLYLNLSLAMLRLDRPLRSLDYSLQALLIDPRNTKALFRCGQAYLEIAEYEKAQEYLTMAQARKPFDPDINNLLRKLSISYKDFLDKEKDMCSKMFPNLNSTVKK
ncbi:inactive peptidyl-prolyl cis-trans isomerase FKBP6 isoform X1 [Osmerus eperlanus]|uniref:inactive peptidyl-prolyl cis-trans isomerase FKBP6 isoform X1 n=2 Tax=Osmerus eperlanus TaxID=29151 RepID=UPI002E100116